MVYGFLTAKKVHLGSIEKLMLRAVTLVPKYRSDMYVE